MYSTRSLMLALLLTSLISIAMMPAGAQANSHTKFIESIRKAVQNPTGDHELYNLVIQPEFVQTAREAAQAGNDTLVVELLQAYSGQNTDRAKGGTALNWAAYYCDAPLLKILLDRGLDVNAQDADGNTPLHQALGIGRVDIVAMLLQKGAKVNIANKAGETPLMPAAADNQTANTRAFLDRGADVNAQNREGKTPLMYAANSGRLDNVKLLLSEGANVKMKDHEGNTTLTIAEKSTGAPYASFHDSPGFLDSETAERLADKAKRDQSALIQLLKRAGGK